MIGNIEKINHLRLILIRRWPVITDMIIDALKEKGAKGYLQGNAPSTGLTSDVLLEVGKPDLAQDSQTGVSTRNGLDPHSSPKTMKSLSSAERHWYALRTTYGREKKAYDYIVNNGGTAFYPTIVVDKLVKGRIKSVTVSRIPNIFFAYGTEAEIKRFVYDNVHLPFLRFYYRHYNNVYGPTKEPIIVPDRQMETLRIVCEVDDQNTIVTTEVVAKFKTGQMVRVVAGPFAGAIGRVGRYKGQQRVGIIIDSVVTAITAYVPTGMMEPLDENKFINSLK